MMASYPQEEYLGHRRLQDGVDVFLIPDSVHAREADSGNAVHPEPAVAAMIAEVVLPRVFVLEKMMALVDGGEAVAAPEITLETAEAAPVEEGAAPVPEEQAIAEAEKVEEVEAQVAEEVPPTLRFEEEEEELSLEETRKRERRLRRELVFDEEVGEVVARRRRKRGQETGELDQWDEYLR